MALRIFNNISSLTAQRLLGSNSDRLGGILSRISSGLRFQKSSDDGGAFSLAVTLRSDTAALKQAARNTNDGLAVINIAEGALNEIANIIVQFRELSTQAASGTIGDSERRSLQLQFDQFRSEIDRISAATEFRGQGLLDGSLAADSPQQFTIQVGIDSTAASRINLNEALDIRAVTSANLGLDGLSIATRTEATAAIEVVADVIDEISAIRAKVGVAQVRLGHAITNLNSSVESMTRASSIVGDADLAEELADLTKQQILIRTGTAMVSQANLNPQAVLLLLQ